MLLGILNKLWRAMELGVRFCVKYLLKHEESLYKRIKGISRLKRGKKKPVCVAPMVLRGINCIAKSARTPAERELWAYLSSGLVV